jgi:macrolide transport system ATP-binding/permease protein
MTTSIQDLRYAIRTLAKSPGFALIAIITLALGIGANTAIFSAVNALFLRSMPVHDPGQLVTLGFRQKGSVGISALSYPDLRDIQRQAGNLVDIFAYKNGIEGLSQGRRANQIFTTYVTGNYFTTLGIKPALGRLILPSEGKLSGSDPVLVLGYSYWKSHFGGDIGIVGKKVRMDGHPVTVVGVAQKGFRGVLNELDVQAYLPLNMVRIEGSGDFLKARDARALFVLGRLRRGVSLHQAQAAVNVITTRLSRQYPQTDLGATIWVLPQRDAAINPMPEPGEHQQQLVVVGLFLALAILVLLLACFNVANILLVRATAREHEMSVRAALGAPRHRLVRQLLTESSLLAFLGCAAGILVGVWGSALLSSIHINISMPITLNFGFDWRVFAYALGAAAAAGAVVGIVPALRASRANPGDALHEGGRTVIHGRHRLRNILVVAQVAGSIVLLIAAGLFTRSLQQAQHMDLGFNPAHVVNFMMDPHEVGYNEAQGREFYKDLLARVRSLPGVQSASLASTFPTSLILDYDSVLVEGRVLPPGQSAPTISVNHVSSDYFKTMGISILRGRPFRDSDNTMAPDMAVINQTMARDFWPNEDPIGRRFKTAAGPKEPWTRVVGVAHDGKYMDVLAKPTPYFYLPLKQSYLSMETLQVRTELPFRSVVPEVEQQVQDLGPGLPVFGVQTMEQILNSAVTGFYAFHLGVYLAAALGLLGLILAVVGVYGVISYSASQRTHEIGIRMALGARPHDIWRIVFGQGLEIVGAGVLIGILGSLAITRVMASFLYGVSAHDPFTYAAVALLISLVALLACYIPARRATKVDPMVALRYE